jgi:hypothetical protein
MEGKQQFIFIDNGYDKIKCAQFSSNLYHDFDYFLIPTFILPHMKNISGLYFNRERMEKRISSYLEKELIQNPFLNAPIPMFKGKFIDMECFDYLWKRIIDQFMTPIEHLHKVVN